MISSFPIEKIVDYTEVSQIKQMNPGIICFKDTLLIVTDWDQNPRIHVYNKNNYKLLGSLGNVGEGPDEFNSPECLCNYDDKDVLQIHDLGLAKIYNVDLPSFLNENQLVISKTYTLPAKLFVTDNIYILGNKIYGEDLNMYNDNKYYVYLADKDKLEIKGKNNPKIEFLDKVESENKKNTAKTFLTYSKDKNKIIAAYLLFNRIDIMNFDFEIEKQLIIGKNELIPISKIPYDQKNIHYYRTPVFYNDTFVVPYNGRTFDEENFGTKKGEIHQFDLNGNPMVRFKIDRTVLSLFYDKKSNFFYAITEDEDSPIIKFKL